MRLQIQWARIAIVAAIVAVVLIVVGNREEGTLTGNPVMWYAGAVAAFIVAAICVAGEIIRRMPDRRVPEER